MAEVQVLISNIRWRAETIRRWVKLGSLPETISYSWPRWVAGVEEVARLRGEIMEILDDRYSDMPKSFDLTIAASKAEAHWLLTDDELRAAYTATGGGGRKAARLFAEIQRRGLNV